MYKYCKNIENNIKGINIISEKIHDFKNMKLNVIFNPDDNQINENIKGIKYFMNIQYQYFRFKTNLNENKNDIKYTIKGEYKNIVENN